MSADHTRWMRLAIDQARQAIASGQTPFGAVIVRKGEPVASAHNEVWKRTDPTAHAEVVCIQNAAKALSSISLAGCEMYTTTEPCPMCAAAIHWSKLDAVYCGATISDAQDAGFSELLLPIEEVYSTGKSKTRVFRGVLPRECAALFAEWKSTGGKAY